MSRQSSRWIINREAKGEVCDEKTKRKESNESYE